MTDSYSLWILMEISSWPCAAISKEERVSFGVSDDCEEVLTLDTDVYIVC